MTVVEDGTRPAASLFAEVIGQDAAVSQLRDAAPRPVHAYLFVGAAGNGGLAAAHGFAAALLCADGGCGHCPACRAALLGRGPDLHVIHRTGAALSVEDARRVVGIAQRRPLESARQVVVITDTHLAERAAPALLKTLEEPPGATVFVLLADHLTPDLTTVASRCGLVDFPPVAPPVVAQWLVSRGVVPDLAQVIADGSGGNPGRAAVMAEDPEVSARASLWSSVPERLTGSGEVAHALSRQLLDSVERATEPLRAEHARQLEALAAEAKEMGERGLPGRKELVDHFGREERRWRADALRAGLGALARAYRDRAVSRGTGPDAIRHAGAAATAVTLITDSARSMERNPNEQLMIQALLVRLGALPL
jgi:DNA polymerase-3 subunit delta'